MTYWILIGLAIAVAGILAAKFLVLGYRLRVGREFREYLAEHHPRVEILAAGTTSISVRLPDGAEGKISLLKLFARTLAERAKTPEERLPYYEWFASMIEDAAGSADPDPERDLPRIRPRPIRTEDLAAFGGIPSRPIGTTGLSLVLVLDSPSSVSYISQGHIDSWGTTFEELETRALANLRATFSPEVVRNAVGGGSLAFVKSMDGHDAARMLLVPECLEPGVAALCFVPDVDTLVVMPWPEGGLAHKGAKKLPPPPGAGPTSRPLLNAPLKATREGIEPAEG